MVKETTTDTLETIEKVKEAATRYGYEMGKRDGIKEVVEWVKKHRQDPPPYCEATYTIYQDDMKAKLKEWGI